MCDSSSSNAMITGEHDRSRSNPIITEYTAKNAPSVVTLEVKAKNIQSQDCFQSNNTNKNDTDDSVNYTELLCKQVTLLLKILAIKNACNATRKLLQNLIVQIQQRNF